MSAHILLDFSIGLLLLFLDGVGFPYSLGVISNAKSSRAETYFRTRNKTKKKLLPWCTVIATTNGSVKPFGLTSNNAKSHLRHLLLLLFLGALRRHVPSFHVHAPATQHRKRAAHCARVSEERGEEGGKEGGREKKYRGREGWRERKVGRRQRTRPRLETRAKPTDQRDSRETRTNRHSHRNRDRYTNCAASEATRCKRPIYMAPLTKYIFQASRPTARPPTTRQTSHIAPLT